MSHGPAMVAAALATVLIIAGVVGLAALSGHTTTLEHVEWSYSHCHVLFDKIVVCRRR